MRPLSIPAMECRAQQGLYLLALEPISETIADKHSYGFRPKRSAADAMMQCYLALRRRGSSKYILEADIKSCRERGLNLSEEKTKITHIDDGFDFLSFNVRKYHGKLIIKPSKNGVETLLADIRATIKSNGTAKTENLIHVLNNKIRGWSNYHRNPRFCS